jgi:hemoglobin
LETAERRALLTAEIAARTGIDAPMIERLVHAFYGKVRADALLGPVFETRIADWDTHLARMCAFWESVALMSAGYHGSPMARHLPLPVDAAHFDRWLELFGETAAAICPPAAAAHFVDRARRIASSLELGIAARNGAMPAPGARYANPELHARKLRRERWNSESTSRRCATGRACCPSWSRGSPRSRLA